MKYKYQARTKKGEQQVGFVEAVNRDVAANILTKHDLFILSLEEIRTPRWYSRFLAYANRVRLRDLVVFTRQFSILLEAQLPLTDVLKTVYGQTTNPALKEALFRIFEDVESGLSLSQALERQGQAFPPFFVSMIRSAEVTGNLEQVTGFLADYVEHESVLLSKARSAVIYPAIVFGLFLVVAFVMIAVVFPQIGPVFAESGVELPLFSRALIGAGTFLGQWWLVILFLFIAIGLIFVDYFHTPEGRSLRDDLKMRLPIFKEIYQKLSVTRIASASSMLIKGGVPVAQAMEIVSQTVNNVIYQDILEDISQSVRQGRSLSAAFGDYPLYLPPLTSQMLSVGEATGRLDQVFTRIASFYNREVSNLLNNLVDLLQPILMIVVGLLVGILFASILLPLYQLTTNLQ